MAICYGCRHDRDLAVGDRVVYTTDPTKLLSWSVARGTQKLYPNRKAPSGKAVSPTCLVSVLSSKIGQGFDL